MCVSVCVTMDCPQGHVHGSKYCTTELCTHWLWKSLFGLTMVVLILCNYYVWILCVVGFSSVFLWPTWKAQGLLGLPGA